MITSWLGARQRSLCLSVPFDSRAWCFHDRWRCRSPFNTTLTDSQMTLPRHANLQPLTVPTTARNVVFQSNSPVKEMIKFSFPQCTFRGKKTACFEEKLASIIGYVKTHPTNLGKLIHANICLGSRSSVQGWRHLAFILKEPL